MSYDYLPTGIRPRFLEYSTADVIVKKPSRPLTHQRAKRQQIQIFSDASRRRLLELCRNCGHYINSQVCLTYHFGMPDTGKDVKRQLNTFLTMMRREYPGIKYIWILEFQKRGVPHFHLFTDRVHEDKQFHHWTAYAWNSLTKESHSNLQWQMHHSNFKKWEVRGGEYMAKEYLAKMDQKVVPEEYHEIGRFWGNSKNMTPIWATIASGKLGISEYAFNKAVRIVTKFREKNLKKYGIKINYRNLIRSYRLPNCSEKILKLVEYYEETKEFIIESRYRDPMPTLQCPFRGY